MNIFYANKFAILFCRPVILYLLNCIIKSTQITESRKSFPRKSLAARGPHVDSPVLEHVSAVSDTTMSRQNGWFIIRLSFRFIDYFKILFCIKMKSHDITDCVTSLTVFLPFPKIHKFTCLHTIYFKSCHTRVNKFVLHDIQIILDWCLSLSSATEVSHWTRPQACDSHLQHSPPLFLNPF